MTGASPSAMAIRRLEWTLRARGPELDTWPEPDRRRALDLARIHPAARELLAAALADDTPPSSDPAAQSRIQSHISRALTPMSPAVRWTAMAAFLVAGLYFGAPSLEAPWLETETAGLVPTIQATTPATMLAALDP